MVKLGEARRVIAAAEKKAAEMGQPMNIAVVDGGGNLVAHVRMDGAWLGSIDISINKAYTARAFNLATKDLAVQGAVGFEAHGHGQQATTEAPATVLNSLMAIGRPAARIGIPGLYVTEDPGAKDDGAREGNLRLRFELGWSKSQSFYTGQTPVLR